MTQCWQDDEELGGEDPEEGHDEGGAASLPPDSHACHDETEGTDYKLSYHSRN